MSEGEATFKDQVTEAIAGIRPALQEHGGDVELVEAVEADGVVQVRLQGACKGCPGARMTLRANSA
ncbi:unnamed protein product, partial [marine sediment metagenome]